jgi:uncharacterized protein (DUF433 family)
MSQSDTDPRSVTIIKVPGKLGGRAHVSGTKLPVWGIVSYLKEGQSKKDILEGFPSLTSEGFDAAISYYAEHREEIEQDYADNQD